MQEWYSGIIPYPILLPIQVGMLLLMVKINTDLTLRRGWFAAPNRWLGHPVQWFSYVYFSSMILRYVVVMILYPERRWFGGTIPIFFHMVLAGYLYSLSRYHCRMGGVREDTQKSDAHRT